uniref:ATP synthase F0 subunit 6 n=2 Tax=Nematus TaxID=355905 RepID=UPI0023D7FBC7|nr:ATP synthase F0 subunit 6 [Nematus trochanteratus]WDQ45593.1 ATP synthase F0 subunit 6 [Nematus trochanteratus]
MMMNLFSIFDPISSIFNLPLNWISSIIGLLMLPQIYWYIMPRMNMIFLSVSKKIHYEMKVLMGNKKNYGSTLILFSLFMFIFFNNLLGLFPYIFTSSSHLTFTLTMALPLWLSFIMFGWIKNTNHMFAHLVPQNTPPILMPFMVMIETISNMIRALTLSVRLTANMIAGHLLMTLLSSLGMTINSSYIMFLLFIQIMLLILESAVAIIQSYVFMILSTLYYSEVN